MAAARRMLGFIGAAASLPVLASAAATPGVPACAVKDQGYQDPDVTRVNGGFEVQDADTCQSYCKGLIGCQVFTFYVNSGGCWLQGLSGKALPLELMPGVWSGPASCPEAQASDGILEALVAAASKSTSSASVEEQPVVMITDGTTLGSAPTAAAAPPPHKTAAKDGGVDLGGVGVVTLVISAFAALVLLGLTVAMNSAAKGGSSKKFRGADLEAPGSPTSARELGSPCSQASWAQDGSPMHREETHEEANDEMAVREVSMSCAEGDVSLHSAGLAAGSTAGSFSVVSVSFASGSFPAMNYAGYAGHQQQRAAEPVQGRHPQPQWAIPPVLNGQAPSEPVLVATISEPVVAGSTSSLQPSAVSQRGAPPVWMQQQAPRDLFDVLDRNGDGVLTRDEFNVNMPMLR
mmetsp:Transcript_165161/g.530094  ORF Transcript_165161/g.530094 Transcript_165161/m.530094 type:complete len:405 (+) Transcript_165161:91-1305(+)|eukprot:CAMPEP_0203869236 /NCGR_PEP_ID=MMETSP0359-20131031/17586_1 /ASSEMBLY_ACC=CAM_ASM_000338 /TAXON_ID=268821 /ORGANISM="Scrippsiella Hangoei, Strain SHTV-5" /LENGTH=404 /DNA_ID=CAMNT_0050787807 /DNA_START=78 /DNA_END=1292 /DNA_ORIENTATION=-